MSATASSTDAARLFDEAARIAASGDYVSAINRVLQSLSRDPAGEPGSLHLLAQLQLQLRLRAEAAQAARAALERAPQWADCRYTLGRALKAAGQLGEAIEQYRAAIQIDPNRPRYFCSLGVAWREAGQPQAAISSYRAALALDASNREARNNLANVLRELGREQEAAHYDGAKAALSGELDRLVNEAAALHARGEHKQALDRWTDVLRLAPDSAMAYHARGVTLNELQLFEEGVAVRGARSDTRCQPYPCSPWMRPASCALIAGRARQGTALRRPAQHPAARRCPENPHPAGASGSPRIGVRHRKSTSGLRGRIGRAVGHTVAHR